MDGLQPNEPSGYKPIYSVDLSPTRLIYLCVSMSMSSCLVIHLAVERGKFWLKIHPQGVVSRIMSSCTKGISSFPDSPSSHSFSAIIEKFSDIQGLVSSFLRYVSISAWANAHTSPS